MVDSSTEYSDLDIQMMRRCFTLARRAGKHVKSNPQVGAVITYQGRIIGEGYHHIYGSDHAERDALANVKPEDQKYLPQSHMYVSLEPCGHHGKTPPCNQAILDNKIPQVTVSTLDPSPKLQGKSISYLSDNGVNVRVGLLHKMGDQLIQPFICNNIKQRPYVILKWAQSSDKLLGQTGKQVWLSNKTAKVLVHKWRSEIDGIMVGTNTALTDNPQLTTRLIKGTSPHRYVLDKNERLPKSLELLSDENPTTVITAKDNYRLSASNKDTLLIERDQWNIQNIMQSIYNRGICRLMIEGGASLLNSIIKEDIWDEARVIQTPIKLHTGLKAPMINGKVNISYNIGDNKAMIINNL